MTGCGGLLSRPVPRAACCLRQETGHVAEGYIERQVRALEEVQEGNPRPGRHPVCEPWALPEHF